MAKFLTKRMYEKRFKNTKVTFRIRESDEVETDGGCGIGGQWLNKTTDDYFKSKRVVLFSLRCIYTYLFIIAVT